MSITLKDFQPINTWSPDLKGPKWGSDWEPQYLVDKTTGRSYWNEPKGTVRVKAFLLTVGTPVVHTIASIANVAFRALILISCAHFWMGKEGEKRYDFKARLGDAGIDLLRIVVAPLVLVGLELAAIYGVFNPYDGRKLYASLERAEYGSCILAPCFQPNPTRHAFGGDPAQRGAF